ncbi:MAG: hypothetical protein ABIQ49_11890, partial [Gemmatimonadales bacterium]
MPPTRSNTQVLVVESRSSRQTWLREALEQSNYEVLDAVSDEAALHVLARRKIACVLVSADAV